MSRTVLQTWSGTLPAGSVEDYAHEAVGVIGNAVCDAVDESAPQQDAQAARDAIARFSTPFKSIQLAAGRSRDGRLEDFIFERAKQVGHMSPDLRKLTFGVPQRQADRGSVILREGPKTLLLPPGSVRIEDDDFLRGIEVFLELASIVCRTPQKSESAEIVHGFMEFAKFPAAVTSIRKQEVASDIGQYTFGKVIPDGTDGIALDAWLINGGVDMLKNPLRGYRVRVRR